MEFLASPELWLSLLTLTFLEIILGIDNVVFVSVAADKVEASQRKKARAIGIYSGAALRVIMLFGLVWLAALSEAALFRLPDFVGVLGGDHSEEVLEVTMEDLVLLLGGLFLLWKGTSEIHDNLEGEHHSAVGAAMRGFTAVVIQMMFINIVFSLDSVLTAIGMTGELEQHVGEAVRLGVMVAAILISTAVMVGSAGAVAGFLEKHPTTKMLALAFILLVGVALVADGLGFHIPRGYLYFAIAFSLFVEVMNVMASKARGHGGKPVELPTIKEDNA